MTTGRHSSIIVVVRRLRSAVKVAMPYTLVPPILTIGFWGLVFVCVVVFEGWSAATEPTEVQALRNYVIASLAVGYTMSFFIAIAVAISAVRERTGRQPKERSESESKTALRYWWAPAAFSVGLSTCLLAVLLVAQGWQAFSDITGILYIYLGSLILCYALSIFAFLMQLWDDWRNGALRAHAKTDRHDQIP
jgi:TRAP-type C4-dicarboxylate transport system permease small subunit